LQLFRRTSEPVVQALNSVNTANRALLQQLVAQSLVQHESNPNLINMRAQRIVDSYLR